ncbi:hypothetical protein [Aestuariivirga litoralis]|uniref:hypothetical protein n=1 Tax=Aestuariivirga litoralis TaxID=2650924 RepID=UPI0018C72DC0|nr:hypothetical protein [Aestuariivirga litoralis]MBG1232872.1 hypothetical protein [Aestuariivirga litoralis]
MFLNTVLLAAALANPAPADFAQVGDLSGRYKTFGTNFDGSVYRGEVLITEVSKTSCKIAWVTGRTSATGICMRVENAFSATYQMNDGTSGLVIYRIADNGTLAGVWTVAGRDGMGTEVLTPVK